VWIVTVAANRGLAQFCGIVSPPGRRHLGGPGLLGKVHVNYGLPRRALNSAVECHLHTVEVAGSNPAAPTNKPHKINHLKNCARWRLGLVRHPYVIGVAGGGRR
jgi:hypothetical protein